MKMKLFVTYVIRIPCCLKHMMHNSKAEGQDLKAEGQDLHITFDTK